MSLKPDSEVKKLVLRPGTLKELDFEFKHYGSVEGQIANPYGKRLYGYKVAAVNDKGEELATTFSDLEGYFIIPDVPYGIVNIIISKDNKELAKINSISVDDLDITLETEIETADSMTPPENLEMNVEISAEEQAEYQRQLENEEANSELLKSIEIENSAEDNEFDEEILPISDAEDITPLAEAINDVTEKLITLKSDHYKQKPKINQQGNKVCKNSFDNPIIYLISRVSYFHFHYQ